jgi:hypothetical protein
MVRAGSGSFFRTKSRARVSVTPLFCDSMLRFYRTTVRIRASFFIDFRKVSNSILQVLPVTTVRPRDRPDLQKMVSPSFRRSVHPCARVHGPDD